LTDVSTNFLTVPQPYEIHFEIRVLMFMSGFIFDFFSSCFDFKVCLDYRLPFEFEIRS